MKRLWNLLWKIWYPVLTRLTGNSGVTFLNYGYAVEGSSDAGPKLEPHDEPDRACIQLYDHVVRSIDVENLDLLEVSCGHGGGASYVTRYLKPKSMHGIDRNALAVQQCKRRYHVQGLTFSCGDAMATSFADGQFDAVINIEASHCYPDVARFLWEVQRVLRPGGHFLFADFRPTGVSRATLAREVEESGLEVMSCEDISLNVIRGMEMNNDKYRELIHDLVGRLLRSPAMSFAGVVGSPIYNKLSSGETVYLLYVLRNTA